MIRLANKYLQVKITEIGAELKSIRWRGYELMHQSDAYWRRTSPHLFPIVGRLKAGQTTIAGKTYRMGIHGLLRDKRFALIECDNSMAVFSYRATDADLEQYPYDFAFKVSYRLTELTLQVTLTVTNFSEQKLPFNIGAHPGFALGSFPLSDFRIEFARPAQFIRPQVTSEGLIDYTDAPQQTLQRLKLTPELFLPDAYICAGISEKRVTLAGPLPYSIGFSYPDFADLALWTVPGADFCCLEPWNGHGDEANTTGEFSTKRGLIWLSPLENKEFSYEIEVKEKI